MTVRNEHGLTPQREAFAQYVATIGVGADIESASDAYRRAYPRSRNWKPSAVWSQASRLLANDKVAARVKGLQAEAAQRHEVTVDSIMGELSDAATVAKKAGQSGALVQAIMGKAKVAGLLIDRIRDESAELNDADVVRGLCQGDKQVEHVLLAAMRGDLDPIRKLIRAAGPKVMAELIGEPKPDAATVH